MSDAEYKIDKLPIKDYHGNSRKVTRIPGEKAGFRPFDIGDRLDMTRFKIMQEDSNANKEFANPLTGPVPDSKHKEDASYGREELRFAVVGLEDVPEKEKGEVLGWVMYMPDDLWREKMIDKKKPGIWKGIKKTLEISFERLPENEEGQGYISSAVREISLRLLQMQGLARDSVRPEVKKLRKIDLAITAYTDPKNLASRRVLERAGFKKIGEIPRYEKNGKEEVNEVYVLDWNKLHKMEQDKMDKLLPHLFTAKR